VRTGESEPCGVCAREPAFLANRVDPRIARFSRFMAAAFQGGDRGVDSRLPANAGFYFPIGNEKVKPPMRLRGGLSRAGPEA